ncbi:hypothetical protein HN51_048278 [Arachis hypogaea]|uniref:DUF3741 domain-containing protein n=1 Tax=Arachis hypogaea TaxID=3818 RepID=A0A445AKD1_ARAHY|nr:uncharacterized protein LOC107625757 [Arachis ipaensis]XP_025633752.1 uncharacterized protein LOC112728002 [Arachis hypogaea]QHO24768.1 uncharacterized protein DS421_12g375140 [Arachis hypogaea]RYR26901.1 hypothetical protein Ahy_B02g061211 [Arachis hypogaea]
MAKHEKPQPGCFSGFLRVILCAGTGTSPPVHPSQDESENVDSISNKRDALIHEDFAATPGLVARLMGLDSVPNTNCLMKGHSPDSVPRSRSVNFVDYLLNFEVGQENFHRRAKTSASFREVPASALAYSQQKQDHDLVVFHNWDYNVVKDHEARRESRKFEVGLMKESKQGKKQSKETGERNQRKNKKISKLKNEPRRVPSNSNMNGRKVRKQSEDKDCSSVSSCSSKSYGYRYSSSGGNGDCDSSTGSCSPLLQSKYKKEFVESNLKNKMRKKKSPKKIESDCVSENLSPISVLDVNDSPSLYGTTSLDATQPLPSNSKWKSSPLRSSSDGIEATRSNEKDGAYANIDINGEVEYYSELFLKLCTMIEKDIRELDCTTKHVHEDFEQICLVFEHKILDLLLHELVNDIVELSC